MRRTLSWFGHVCRHDIFKELTGQSISSWLRIADDRGRQGDIAVDISVGVPPTMPIHKQLGEGKTNPGKIGIS